MTGQSYKTLTGSDWLRDYQLLTNSWNKLFNEINICLTFIISVTWYFQVNFYTILFLIFLTDSWSNELLKNFTKIHTIISLYKTTPCI